ncbi:secreted RxLR effector protein 161-like [Vigna angularis]|uniref:secreted RxLR effector protein 161-like n=1 Tax=Phaseolus angularis TaxID=3914 RepID=UPI0022B3CB40|nr:secreted RxLR effector protein 161-like [Vigna angularis]
MVRELKSKLDEARQILGIDIRRDKLKGNLFYLKRIICRKKVVSRCRISQSKPVGNPLGQRLKLTKEQRPKTEDERKKMESIPYSNGIGSIMYDMVCTRPELAHGVGVLSRFMTDPGQIHWEALKWMFRHIKGSLDTGLLFQNNFQGGGFIEGFVDSDFAGCMDTRKSLFGYVFTLYGTVVSWKSTLQSVVALSFNH